MWRCVHSVLQQVASEGWALNSYYICDFKQVTCYVLLFPMKMQIIPAPYACWRVKGSKGCQVWGTQYNAQNIIGTQLCYQSLNLSAEVRVDSQHLFFPNPSCNSSNVLSQMCCKGEIKKRIWNLSEDEKFLRKRSWSVKII